jgi:hypothetical protein
VVSSSISAGHTPKECCSLAPSCGHAASTSLIRDAPTTQVGKSQPSASTAKTSSGEHFIKRMFVDKILPGSIAVIG